jgi:Protein of unknown function (DUF2845)
MAFDKLMICAVAFTTTLALSATKAAADDMSCQDRIISTGSSAYDVQFLCGAPDFVDHRSEVQTVRRPVSVPCYTPRGIGRCIAYVEDAVEVAVEEWTYDFGPHRFVRYLTFAQGRVVAIRAGSYGHKQF